LHLPARVAQPAAAPFAPNAFVRVGTDDTITVLVKHLEFGQGPLTGLATLVAEEMDAAWPQVRAEHAPVNAELYKNLFFSGLAPVDIQGTGGSTAIANSYEQLRLAGATARAMLVAAAAQKWQVHAAEITIDKGVLRHSGSGKEGSFGAFTAVAAKLPPPDPASVKLKDPATFRLIGREGMVRRLDVPDKTNGRARYTIDIREPEMVTVVVAHPPCFGSPVASFDAAGARRVAGVIDIRQVSTGVAVYAQGTWPAIKARRMLDIAWDETAAEKRSSEQISEEYRALARTRGVVAAAHGDPEAAFAEADRTIEAEYLFPYLAHAPMEPLAGYLLWDGKRARARFGSQMPTGDQFAIATVFGIELSDVEIETVLAGGSFGRRGEVESTFAAELAEVAKVLGPGRPVKLMWTREDDIQGGLYRPMFVHRLRGAIKDGVITGWTDTIVGQSFIKGTLGENFGYGYKDGIDQLMIEGATELSYTIPHFRCDAHIVDVGVPVMAWRSVGHSHTAYAVECFIDELLEATGQDPVEGRLALMGHSSREAGVLRAAAELAGWSGSAPEKGRARGVAMVKSRDTYVAHVAEVSVGNGGEPRVHKVWCAVDCGVAVNPDVIRAQMEGGIGFGLGHALFAEVSLEQGRPVQSNFDTYRSLRIAEMPEVEVTIIPSTEGPTGVGEPGVPPIAPAVANAMARLGVGWPRRLPISGEKV
jgi:isoquinoline 1-oxidoreductase beta subunit